MPKFCQECGATLDEHARFCSSCGSRIPPGGPSRVGTKYRDPAETEGKVTKNGSTISWSGIFASLAAMMMGFIAILFLYLAPIVRVGGLRYSIAAMNSRCSNSLLTPTLGSTCSEYWFWFSCGWLIAILFLFGGMYELLYARKKRP